MEIEIGESISIVCGETIITGRLRGLRLDRGGNIEAIWIDELDIPFHMADGWLVLDPSEDEEMTDIFRDEDEE